MSYLYIRSNCKGQCRVNLNLSTEITSSFLVVMTSLRRRGTGMKQSVYEKIHLT